MLSFQIFYENYFIKRRVLLEGFKKFRKRMIAYKARSFATISFMFESNVPADEYSLHSGGKRI